MNVNECIHRVGTFTKVLEYDVNKFEFQCTNPQIYLLNYDAMNCVLRHLN